MTLPGKLSLPLGIIVSVIVTAASAGGSYAALSSADKVAAEKIAKHEADIAALTEHAAKDQAFQAQTAAKLDGLHEDVQAIKGLLMRRDR
jgi:uncharacterized protein (UPF0333 family)